MGATFHWLPTSKGKTLDVGARSHVGEVLDRLFGHEPWLLQDGEWLRTLRASDPKEPAWEAIENALASTDQIRVWRSY